MAAKTVSPNGFINKFNFSQKRVLLVNPPVIDYRFPWAKWHQPLGLLKLGAYVSQQGSEVKLLDFLHHTGKKYPQRKKIGSTRIDGYDLPLWMYGSSGVHEINDRLRKILKDWQPDYTFVTSLNSIWWKPIDDVIRGIRKHSPGTKVFLGGAYPTNQPSHAKLNSGADYVVRGFISDVATNVPDFSIYENVPKSAGILFYQGNSEPRKVKHILDEINENVGLGVNEIVFLDKEIHQEHIAKLENLLSRLARRKINPKLIFLGNLSARLITKPLATKLKNANVHRLYFRCNRDFNSRNKYEDSLSDYKRAMKALTVHASFKPRAGEIAAMVQIGVPFEDIEELTKWLIQLASIVGSVISVPFQYVQREHNRYTFGQKSAKAAHVEINSFLKKHIMSPEMLNGKLFPFAKLTGLAFEDYMEITRLSTLLNSKFRGKTFDFLEDSIMPNLFRASIKKRGWDPFKRTKKPILLDNQVIINSEQE